MIASGKSGLIELLKKSLLLQWRRRITDDLAQKIFETRFQHTEQILCLIINI